MIRDQLKQKTHRFQRKMGVLSEKNRTTRWVRYSLKSQSK